MWSKATEEISICINNSKNNTKSKLFKKDINRKIQFTSKIRNGVEGIPSILRRKYHVDVMPVRRLVQSIICFF